MSNSNGSTEFKTPLPYRIKRFARGIVRVALRPKVVRKNQLVVMDESGGCENPIFLIGMHRSGTTLMRRIINAHSHIACPPETFFLTALQPFLADNRFHNGLKSMGFDREGIAKGLRSSASYFFEAYRQSKGKDRWADKTPEYVQILPFIEELFGPGCQYLMLYRHPFDVMNSLLSSGWDFTKDQWQVLDYHDDQFTNVLMYHADMLDRQLSFQDAHADRCHAIKYEDLTTDPESVLRPAMEFLGEPWEPDILEYHKHDDEWGVGDPTAKSSRGFKPSMGNWKGWTDEQIARATEVLSVQLNRLGYDTTR